MKAIAISHFVDNYSDLHVSEVPSPSPFPTNNPDSILVSISHASLNHVDLLYARGRHQNNASGLVAPPFILGLEFAGIVVAAAPTPRSDSKSGSEPGPSKFKPGDRVWGSAVGAFATEIAVSASALQHVPDGWSLEEVAGLGAATAPVSYGALAHVARVQRGESVLVHAAAGGLGVAAVQIARALGATRIIATVGSAEKADIVRRSKKLDLDADAVIRYDEPGWEKAVLEASGGTGVDVVFDTVGLVEKSLRCLRYGGRIVVAGFAGLDGKMEKVAMNRILLKGAIVLGYRYGESGRRNPTENAAIWHGLNAMLERGQIRPVIYGTYRGLESVPRALEDLAARKVFGKAIITLSPCQPLQSRI